MTTLTLLNRDYCHLCEDMRDALAPYLARWGVALSVIDVDADEALTERYNELVPVLLHGERELCHHFLDLAALEAWWREQKIADGHHVG